MSKTTIKLKSPVEVDGKTFSEMIIEEPAVAALLAFDDARNTGKSDMGAMIVMIVAMTGWPEAAVLKIKASDFRLVSDAIAPFMQAATPSDG